MMERGFSHWLFEEQNWRWVLFGVLAAMVVSVAIYSTLTMDPDLWFSDRRVARIEALEQELNDLLIPERSFVKKRQNLSRESSILLVREFRTELSPEQFLKEMDSQLRQRGWIYRKTDNSDVFKAYEYCRGNTDAKLYHEGSKGFLFSDGGDYWKLHFSLGLRSTSLFEELPDGCSN